MRRELVCVGAAETKPAFCRTAAPFEAEWCAKLEAWLCSCSGRCRSALFFAGCSLLRAPISTLSWEPWLMRRSGKVWPSSPPREPVWDGGRGAGVNI